MYVVEFNGTKEEFCERFKNHREKVEAFPTTVGVPAPQEIFPKKKIVEGENRGGKRKKKRKEKGGGG